MIARIAALVAVIIFATAHSHAAPAEPLSLENEFIRVVVNRGPDEAGRFSIRTTGGDPSRPTSRNQHLIFGGNAPWTSYTTLLIDGEKYVFGGKTQRRAGRAAKYGKEVTPPSVADGKIVTTYRCGDIEVTQELGFARGASTRMLDTIGITYRLANRGAADHQVGLRVMLDTMCGANDGAPVRAASQAITTAAALAQQDVPDFWQAFDSLSQPTVISQGTLKGGTLTPPQKIIFADWGTLADEPWEPAIASGMGFIRKGETDPDTAVAICWNPRLLDAGASTAWSTDYGIGEVSLKAGNLTLGLTAPAETTFAHERTRSFTITGYMQNVGGFDARDVVLVLALPDGLSLVEGKVKNTYPLVRRDATIQASWEVRANGKQGGAQKLDLSVTSANIETNRLQREILLHVPAPTVQLLPGRQSVPLTTNGMSTIVPIQINLLPAESFYSARLTVKYDPKVVCPLGEPFGVQRGRAFVENGQLLGWSYTDDGNGTLTITGTRKEMAPITQAETNLATIIFRTTGVGTSPLQLSKAVAVNTAGEESPLRVTTGEVTITADPTR